MLELGGEGHRGQLRNLPRHRAPRRTGRVALHVRGCVCPSVSRPSPEMPGKTATCARRARATSCRATSCRSRHRPYSSEAAGRCHFQPSRLRRGPPAARNRTRSSSGQASRVAGGTLCKSTRNCPRLTVTFPLLLLRLRTVPPLSRARAAAHGRPKHAMAMGDRSASRARRAAAAQSGVTG